MGIIGGYVSTPPGTLLILGEDTYCDDHKDRLAVKRVQGETDSFTYVAYDMCQECYNEYLLQVEEIKNGINICEWCNTKQKDIRRRRRNIEEKKHSHVYDVCPNCWNKYLEYINNNY